MKLQKGDFVEIEYTGRLKDSNEVFDTTDEAVAKSNNLHNPKIKYGPLIICIGQRDVLKGLDDQLEGKETEKTYTLTLQPENAFGKKQAKLIQLIPTSKFTKNNIKPFPGLQVNADGMLGIIKTVSGGRTLVDFNHPFSSKEILYDLKINKIITDDKEKVSSIVELLGRNKPKEVTINEKKATVKTEDLPPQIQMLIKSKIKKILDLEVDFTK